MDDGVLNRFKGFFRKKKHGAKTESDFLDAVNHRDYVGGMWDEIGRLQFDFMVKSGLEPSHCFCDVACGSFRGGIHFIRYLDGGKYLGIEKEKQLVDVGVEKEIGEALWQEKKPEIVISDSFEFKRFTKVPDYSLAISLFTHLVPEDIIRCLANLREFVDPGHLFFVTFFDEPSEDNPEESHSNVKFAYPRPEMEEFGRKNGWNAVYIGDWNHPRGQLMMKFEAV